MICCGLWCPVALPFPLHIDCSNFIILRMISPPVLYFFFSSFPSSFYDHPSSLHLSLLYFDFSFAFFLLFSLPLSLSLPSLVLIFLHDLFFFFFFYDCIVFVHLIVNDIILPLTQTYSETLYLHGYSDIHLYFYWISSIISPSTHQHHIYCSITSQSFHPSDSIPLPRYNISLLTTCNIIPCILFFSKPSICYSACTCTMVQYMHLYISPTHSMCLSPSSPSSSSSLSLSLPV